MVSLPSELQLKNLVRVYVDKRRAYALEIPSHPIDSNPIFVFADDSVPNSEGVVRAMCAEKGAWRFSRKLDEAGWYYVNGPQTQLLRGPGSHALGVVTESRQSSTR
ncbi:MAG TPA: hypothetical protein VM533_04810 [Fimbriiglobus sp.]|nr:hypothetical protein [Fimbriiglobus sp.]